MYALAVHHKRNSQQTFPTISGFFMKRTNLSLKASHHFEIESETGNPSLSLKAPDEIEEASYLIYDDDTKSNISSRARFSPRAAIVQKIQQLSDSLISQKSLLKAYSDLSPTLSPTGKGDEVQKERSQKENSLNSNPSNKSWAIVYPDDDDDAEVDSIYPKSSDEAEKAFPADIILSRKSICMKCMKKYSNRCTFILIGFIVSVFITFTILLTEIPCDTLEAFQMFKSPNYFIAEGSDQILSDETFHVVLFGDSLMHRPFLEFDLSGKIQALLPQFHLRIKDCGFDAATINDLRMNKRYMDCVLNQTNTAVILFWDSDVSNVDESTMSETEVQQLREDYLEDVSYVIENIKDTGALLALAGPALLGESGKKLKGYKKQYENNQIMLDAYTLMNQQISRVHNIPYINVRFPFLNSIPPYQWCYSGNLDRHSFTHM
jgi:hypothetical protein